MLREPSPVDLGGLSTVHCLGTWVSLGGFVVCAEGCGLPGLGWRRAPRWFGVAGDIRLRVMLCVVVGCVMVSLANASAARASGWEVRAVPSQRCPTGSSRRFRARRRAAVPRSGPSSTTRIRVPRRLWPRGGTARPGRSSTSPFRPPRIMARSVTCRARQPRRASRWGRSRTVPISPRPSPSAGTAPAGRSSGSPCPRGADFADVHAVSCSSERQCMAVGFADYPVPCESDCGDFSRVLVERWNGKRWSLQRVSTPAGKPSSSLSSVSCTSRRACVAVGSVSDYVAGVGIPPAGMLVGRLNGTRWVVPAAPRSAPLA